MLTFNNITADTYAADTRRGAGRRRPRYRETLSCALCRERKVGCDRKQPCKQCQTKGCGNSCSYSSVKNPAASHGNGSSDHEHYDNRPPTQDGGHSQTHQPHKTQTESSSPMLSDSGDFELRRRLDRLELLLAANNALAGNSHTRSSDEHTGRRDRDRSSSLVAGNTSLPVRNAVKCPQGPVLSAKTALIAGSHWLAACSNMPVLKAMLNKSPEFSGCHKSFAQVKAWTKSINAVSIPYSVPCSDSASLFALLPPQTTCEGWIRAYRQTYRHVYDVVDELTLESAVEKVWSSPGGGDDPTVVCLVMMLVCVGMQTDDSQRLNGRKMARHVEQFNFITGLLQKPCIGSMEVLLLLVLLKTIACSDTESPESLSGIMGLTSQVALGMGLHRNPATFGDITDFHSEIRKRLWWTYYRLNFEHCMRTGIPAALQPDDTDVGYPANINLSETVSADVEPRTVAQELSCPTDATFGIVAARLAVIAAPYQRAICSPNSPGTIVSPEAMTQLQDSYHDLLTECPAYMRPGSKPTSSAEEIQQAFLTIALRSTSLVLAQNFVVNVSPELTQKQHLLTVWENCLSVLHSFQVLSQKHWHLPKLGYQLLWSDACRAAFGAGLALNRLRIMESKSIMATRLQHTLIPLRDTLLKHLVYMSKFLFQNAHLGPTASKNCLLITIVVAVTSKLISGDHEVSEAALMAIGARSVETMVESMKKAMKQRHSLPMSPEPSVSSASHSTHMFGENGRGISSPNVAENWPTTNGLLLSGPVPTNAMMDPFSSSSSSSGGGVGGHAFVPPDPVSVVGWAQEMQWPMDSLECSATSSSVSPVSHMPSGHATTSAFTEGLISPPGVDWSGTSQWLDDVRMSL